MKLITFQHFIKFITREQILIREKSKECTYMYIHFY